MEGFIPKCYIYLLWRQIGTIRMLFLSSEVDVRLQAKVIKWCLSFILMNNVDNYCNSNGGYLILIYPKMYLSLTQLVSLTACVFKAWGLDSRSELDFDQKRNVKLKWFKNYLSYCILKRSHVNFKFNWTWVTTLVWKVLFQIYSPGSNPFIRQQMLVWSEIKQTINHV